MSNKLGPKCSEKITAHFDNAVYFRRSMSFQTCFKTISFVAESLRFLFCLRAKQFGGAR